jgi:hypothetical protein
VDGEGEVGGAGGGGVFCCPQATMAREAIARAHCRSRTERRERERGSMVGFGAEFLDRLM